MLTITGLVSISGDNVVTGEDFDNFSIQQASATPTPTNSDDYTPSNTMPTTYPATTSTGFLAIGTLAPQVYAPLCECMSRSTRNDDVQRD